MFYLLSGLGLDLPLVLTSFFNGLEAMSFENLLQIEF